MKKSTKVWLAIIGFLLIALGVYCLCKPASTLFSTAILIGILTLVTGIAKIVFTFKTQTFMPNSGTRMLSGLFLVILGIIFLVQKVFLTISLPVVFTLWVLVEGVIIAVQSFDYKKSGFKYWWVIFVLGIVGAISGVLGLRDPNVSAITLSILIGIGIIILGAAHLVALCGVKQIENQVDTIRRAINYKEEE